VLYKNLNIIGRESWLKEVINRIPKGSRLLDAGAGELRNRQYCDHLDYVSQDFCQYDGSEKVAEGLHSKGWDTSRIDLVSDITDIPTPDSSFDVVLCSEVLEHVPDPTHALDEFARIVKPGGKLIITAPFSSNVHMAPYHYCTGFSKYWYEHHLAKRGFKIQEITANGDWYSLLLQEISRLGGLERQSRNWSWPIAYGFALLGMLYYKLRSNHKNTDLACFGWHCVAVKN